VPDLRAALGRAALSAAAAACLATASVHASSIRTLDHDEVRDAVRAGHLAPLEAVMGASRSMLELRMIDVRALSRDDILLFEVLILEDDGHVLQLYYDGSTAELIGWTGAGAGASLQGADFVEALFDRLATARASQEPGPGQAQ
jgi:hypothetical protein